MLFGFKSSWCYSLTEKAKLAEASNDLKLRHESLDSAFATVIHFTLILFVPTCTTFCHYNML